MLDDPLSFPATETFGPGSGSATVNAHISASVQLFTLDFSPGATVRSGELSDGTKVTLNIKHSLSQENAPFTTDRSLVRIDLERINATTGKPVRASFYTLASVPRGPDFSRDDALAWLRNLAVFTGFGKTSSGDLVDADNSMARILAGEP
jgi:hypothetical protein